MKRIMLIFLSLVAISVLLVSCGTGQAYARYGCGNGVKEAKEECDDGNGVDTDSCSNTCVVQQPDLVIDDLTISKEVHERQLYVNVDVTVKNIGLASTGVWFATLFSIDGVPFSTAFNTGQQYSDPLAPNAQDSFSRLYKCTADHLLDVTTDRGNNNMNGIDENGINQNNRIAESNEENNGKTITVTC